jgi:ubiquinone/menaquinone biosynthesis C-methylase UbiE
MRREDETWYNMRQRSSVRTRYRCAPEHLTSIYQAYAPFYDGSGQLRFAVLMAQYLAELLLRHPVAGQRALDLACGTGTLALDLADKGWDVVGLDGSAAMLALARAKAANLDTPGRVAFVLGDMRDLVFGPWSFDLVTCVYDSLNYLLVEDELAACFRSAARALAPGGLLVADMNTRHFLEHDWGTCEVIEQAGLVQVSQSYFDPATACSTMVLTGFAGDDEHGYLRFDETHIERAYDPPVVAETLAAAGLVVEGIYDCFTFQPVGDRTQRIAWVARKSEARD